MMRTDQPVRRVELDRGVEIDRTAWWAKIPAIAAVLDHGLNIPRGVTFLVGENGSGKSTLVEGLAGAFGLNVEGGSRNARHQTRAIPRSGEPAAVEPPTCAVGRRPSQRPPVTSMTAPVV